LTSQVCEKKNPFNIEVDGEIITTCDGQTVAAALIAAGKQMFRHTPSGAPRGVFCGMGVCFDCLVTVDGLADQRACVTPVRPGMRVRLGSA
jgi:predicted molibdopterin-dependent oxidoreductase YjgC